MAGISSTKLSVIARLGIGAVAGLIAFGGTRSLVTRRDHRVLSFENRTQPKAERVTAPQQLMVYQEPIRVIAISQNIHAEKWTISLIALEEYPGNFLVHARLVAHSANVAPPRDSLSS